MWREGPSGRRAGCPYRTATNQTNPDQTNQTKPNQTKSKLGTWLVALDVLSIGMDARQTRIRTETTLPPGMDMGGTTYHVHGWPVLAAGQIDYIAGQNEQADAEVVPLGQSRQGRLTGWTREQST